MSRPGCDLACEFFRRTCAGTRTTDTYRESVARQSATQNRGATEKKRRADAD
jgi:hypothetical protein